MDVGTAGGFDGCVGGGGAGGAVGQAAGAEVSSYTPLASDVGYRLRARVSYSDGHGTGKQAQSAATALVGDVPGVPGTLTASPGNGQVRLGWTAADSSGSAIVRYESRYHDGSKYTPATGKVGQSVRVNV